MEVSPEQYLTDVINGLIDPDMRRRGECPGNLSFWNPGGEYKGYLSERLEIERKGRPFDYVYSQALDAAKPLLARLGARNSSEGDVMISASSTLTIVHAVNLLKFGGIRRIAILSPSYFSVQYCCRAFGIACETIALDHDADGWHLPAARLSEGRFDALWVTSPIYGTGETLPDEMVADLCRLRDERDLFLICDESLALPGQELVRRIDVDDSTVFIYSPHKAISVNACKFSVLVHHKKFHDAIVDWSDVFGGALPQSSIDAVRHYLSDNYHEVCVPAYRAFVRAREADLSAVLAEFPWVRLRPRGSGHYRTLFTDLPMPDTARVVELIDHVRRETGCLFYPGTLTGLPSDWGLAFRINLLLDRAFIRDGLPRVLRVLEDS